MIPILEAIPTVVTESDNEMLTITLEEEEEDEFMMLFVM